jgi:hypothetical protein
MFADPKFTPVTCGCVAGVVAPATMETVAGDTVTFDGSLLASDTVRPTKAGVDKVTWNATDWFGATVTLVGRFIDPTTATVMVAVVSAKFGRELAWMTVEPVATPVTGTLTLVAFAANVTVAGTVATPGLSELTLTITPPGGAGDDRFNVRFCVTPWPIVMLTGEKLRAAPATCTVFVSLEKPGADAPIIAEPKLTPVTCGCVTGVIAPWAIVIVVGLTVTFVKSLVASVMVTPPTGAGVNRLTAKGADCPNPTVTPACSTI